MAAKPIVMDVVTENVLSVVRYQNKSRLPMIKILKCNNYTSTTLAIKKLMTTTTPVLRAIFIQHFSIEFDVDSMNEDAEYTAPLTSPTPADQNIIIYQLKAFKHDIHYMNEWIDDMIAVLETSDDENNKAFQ